VRLPISDVATSHSHLHLWSTTEHLWDAMRLFSVWGFTYRTVLVCNRPASHWGSFWHDEQDFLLLLYLPDVPSLFLTPQALNILAQGRAAHPGLWSRSAPSNPERVVLHGEPNSVSMFMSRLRWHRRTVKPRRGFLGNRTTHQPRGAPLRVDPGLSCYSPSGKGPPTTILTDTVELLTANKGNREFRSNVLSSSFDSGDPTSSQYRKSIRRLIEQVSPPPYLEVFGRGNLLGWKIIPSESKSVFECRRKSCLDESEVNKLVGQSCLAQPRP
jgi:hypothetical protein